MSARMRPAAAIWPSAALRPRSRPRRTALAAREALAGATRRSPRAGSDRARQPMSLREGKHGCVGGWSRSWRCLLSRARRSPRGAEKQAARIAFGLLAQSAHRGCERIQLGEQPLEFGQALVAQLLHAASRGVDCAACAGTCAAGCICHLLDSVGAGGDAFDRWAELLARERR